MIEIRCLPTHSNTYDQELEVRVDDEDPAAEP
jgi:hypothetical protein